MRLWHLFVVILALSLILTIVRDPVGRIALIVFVTALGEVVIGTTAVMALFQTIGSLGEAKGLVRSCGGRRHDSPGLDHRHDDHVVVAVRGCMAGPGFDTLNNLAIPTMPILG